MKIISWDKASVTEQAQALRRPALEKSAAVTEKAGVIVGEVKKRGDEALREFSLQLEGVALKDFRVSPQEVAAAVSETDPRLRAALMQAKANIEAFHALQSPAPARIETMPGVMCEWHWRPLETIGIYIPSGTAPLFSTVLMQAIPARIAGCKRIVLCTPPQKNGKLHPAILAAAQLCGIEEIYAIGGAQAIAAMAYGTATVPKVDKVYGPGNAWVTAAKQFVSQDPEGAAIDLPAGPSEVMVIADRRARADWVASDLLAQAEHDAAAQVILITPDSGFAKSVQTDIQKQLTVLPRHAIAAKSLEQGRIIIVSGMEQAIEIANRYAPEHLIIHNEEAAKYLPDIRHAGSVFCGAWTPEAAGDYASGTNHVLPTYGYARAYSGLTVLSFMKSMTVQTITPEGLRLLGPSVVIMAAAEGLAAHANAITLRLEERA